jgi:OmcA/MtrC family decaheme c-type cytochrome
MSIKLADLIPASTGTNTWSTAYWEMWDAETPGKAAAAPNPATNNIDVSSSATGSYSYTTVIPFGGAWPGYNNADYAAANKKMVAIEFSSIPAGWNYNKALPGILEFSADPGVGNTAAAIASVRQFVTIQACRQCHGQLMDGAVHANSRNDIRECDLCHSALYGSLPKHAPGFMAEDNADLPVFIHGIHGSTWNDTDDQFVMGPNVQYPVTYPQELKNCAVCHQDPANTGADQIDNWKNHPTGRVCHSCHTTNVITAATTTIAATFTHDNTITTKTPVPAGPKTDAQCAGCHAGLGTAGDNTDIVTVHSTAPAGNDVPEYDVTIARTPPANGTNYVSGETFTVDVTLATKPAITTQTPVPAAYTTASDAAYHSGGGLHVASLYVYGPRSFAKPLTGTQANSLFGKGDATGFHYKVTVPANTTAGTYFIRVRIADYSYDRNNPTGGGAHVYQTESIGLNKFQIGTATEQKKIDGNADCKLCHGDTLMHNVDHACVFDTDECVACHDQSGGHAAYIGNRVHAIHTHSATGDMVDGRDWSQFAYEFGKPVLDPLTGPTVTGPVTFPLGDISPATSTSQSTQMCVICHDSTSSGTYKTNVYETPCLGCHGDVSGALDHMLQNGGDFK